jgi:hypothetical protein
LNAFYHCLDDTNVDFFQLLLDSTAKFILIFCFLSFGMNCTSQQSPKIFDISFGHYLDVFLFQPFQRFFCIMARCQIGPKDCFVIFVLLLDEFDHFGPTFGDINVSIDSLTLDRCPSEGCRDKNFIPVKVLCENVKYFTSSITITFWSQKFLASLRMVNHYHSL